MWPIIAGLLVLWLICIILGAAFKAIAWLVLVGAIFLVLTLAFGVIHEVMSRHRHRM
jgi:hypothetical protein